MDSILCFNCNKEQDDMLILGCKHSLCLVCSYTVLNRDERNYHFKFICCDVCNDLTNIEEDTLMEIFNYNGNNLNKTKNNTNDYIFSENDSKDYSYSKVKSQSAFYAYNPKTHTSLSQQESKYNILSSEKILSSNNMKLFCNKHNEELTYFCFDCFQKCICSECVVHGDHKNHEVLNVKKAYPLIIEKANEYIGELSGRITDIGHIYNSLETKKKEVLTKSEGIKQEMQNAFQEIRIRLDKKEKELLDKADMIKNEQIQEISTFSRIIQGKLVSLNKMIDHINSNLMRREDTSFINFFSEAKEKINSFMEEDYQNLIELNSINSVRININSDTLNSMINTLNGIHLEISNLKGFEIIKNERKNYLKLNTINSNNKSTDNRSNHISKETSSISRDKRII